MTPDVIAAQLHIDDTRWPDKRGQYHADCPYCNKPAKKNQTHFTMTADGLCYCQVCKQGTTVHALADRLGVTPPKSMPAPRVEYDYHNADGVVVYQVVRYEKDGKKSFFQRHADDKGGWVNGMNGVDRVLYRLPEVIAAVKDRKTIYIVEGEKDADALRLRGLCATTNPQGAGKWSEAYSATLRGAAVIILPDNDEPGADHARTVARSLQGIATSIAIVNLPGLNDKGDVSDWFTAGHSVKELETLCEMPTPPHKTITSPTNYVASWRSRGITLYDLQRKEFPPEKWIIENILPEGACLLAAKYKSRKSWIGLAAGLAIAMGGKAFGRLDVLQGRVLYLDLEGKQQRIKKRTRAMIGVMHIDWPKNFHVYEEWPQGDEGLYELENWFKDYPDTAYVVIDVLADHRRPIEKHEMPYMYDRATVKPINALFEQYHAAALLVHHFNKAKNDDIMDSISGTTGLPSAVNTMWGLSRDPNDSAITVLHLRGRDLENDDPIALRWDTYLNMHVIEGPASEVSISGERKSILKLLSDDEPRTPKEIATELSRPVASIQQLLRKLLNDGLIDKPLYGKYALVRHPDQSDQTDQSSNSDQSSKTDRQVPTLIGGSGTDQSCVRQQDAVNANSDHSDRYIEGKKQWDLSIVEIERNKAIFWQVWDDVTNTMLSEHATQHEAYAEANRRMGR